VHLFIPWKYVENHPDVSWLKPQKARWSTTKRWYFHGRYRRSMSVRWYLPSCHLHLKKKIRREKKHKDPSCRLKKKIKMERKEIRRTVLQVLRSNLKRKDGIKRTILQMMMSDWRCSLRWGRKCKFSRIDRIINNY